MTDKPTPTDAELKAMWQLHAADIGGIFYYARAVLAKWGTPAHVGAEPAKRQYYYKVDGCPAVDSESPGCICWHDEGAGPRATADPTLVSWRGADQVLADPEHYFKAVRDAERAHVIKGGQHHSKAITTVSTRLDNK